MFLDGYKRNWLRTEGFSFEDRMIDDLSVSSITSCLKIKKCVQLYSVFIPVCSWLYYTEGDGGRGGGRGGEGDKA